MSRDLKINDVRKVIGCSRERVLQLITAGHLEAYQLPATGQHRCGWRITPEALARFRSAPVAVARVRALKTLGQRLAEEAGL